MMYVFALKYSLLQECFPCDLHISILVLTAPAEFECPDYVILEPLVQLLALLCCVRKYRVQVQLLQLLEVSASNLYY